MLDTRQLLNDIYDVTYQISKSVSRIEDCMKKSSHAPKIKEKTITITKDEMHYILKGYCEDEYNACPLDAQSFVNHVFKEFGNN